MDVTNASEVIQRIRDGEKIPLSAMRINSEPVTLEAKDGEKLGKTVKVHIKARSRQAINHPYWGSVIHDFSTARLPSKVALDHTHGDEPIGYGRPETTAYGLELDGHVTPTDDNPSHPANALAHALKSGVPMQASIDFSGDYDVLEVPELSEFEVNGLPVKGPAAVIRNWTLRACALCKSGADASTSTELLSQSDNTAPRPRSITTLSADKSSIYNKEHNEMSTQTQFEMLTASCPTCGEKLEYTTDKTEVLCGKCQASVKIQDGKPVVPLVEKQSISTDKPATAEILVVTDPVKNPAEVVETPKLSEVVDTKPVDKETETLRQQVAELSARMDILSKPRQAEPVKRPVQGTNRMTNNKHTEWQKVLQETQKANPHLRAGEILKIARQDNKELWEATKNIGWMPIVRSN